MDTKSLRQKILDLAIRGKLVPQDPNDEPASVLLERIRTEKQQMVKDGKLKAKDIKGDSVIFKGEDNLHYEKIGSEIKCIESEIPFEVPEGWAWSRVGTIFFTITGNTPSTKEANLYGNDYPFFKPSDLDCGYSVIDATDYVSKKGCEVGRFLPEKSVLVTCIGATIGKTGLVWKSGICNQQINAILPNEYMLPEFVYYLFISDFEQTQIKANASATTLPILNKSKFDNLLILLPPYSEQLKIAEVISDRLSIVAAIESEKSDLLAIIAQVKSKILDLAIRGKLVPQDPDDEPASVLLERIRAEKEQLIKEGKIKRDKNESYIFRGDDKSYYEKVGDSVACIDTDIPYAVPDNWAWTRLSNLGSIIGGGTPKTSDPTYWGNGTIAWITPADLSGYTEKYISRGERNITEKGLQESSAQLMPKGSVLFSSRAPIGYITISANEVCTNQGFKSVVPYELNLNEYLYYYLKARLAELKTRASGTTFKEISGTEFGKTLVALPPLHEQKAITSNIETALERLSIIMDNLS